jgi:kynureninase
MSIPYKHSLSFARGLDENDPMNSFRPLFRIPQRNGKDCIYFCGNSLGLQPKAASNSIAEQMDNWAHFAVEGHFEGATPWMTYHKQARKTLSHLVGAKEHEVVAMNSLTVNLHLLLVTFYQPKGQRRKILMEKGAFPSDQYALESHLKWYGYDPEECIIEVEPDVDNNLYSTDHIIREVAKAGDELALVLFSGIQYYTGQLFDMAAITKAAHDVGALAGFDLAHAMGNVPMSLHDAEVDFATWCSYKYLNSSPGGISGIYVHEKHAANKDLNRFGGWWGHNEQERFKMKKGFDPTPNADGWQLSNAPVLLLAAHMASLDIFEKAGIDKLRKKSVALTGFLEFLLRELNKDDETVQIITSSNPEERGSQLSLFITNGNKEVFNAIQRRGVIADWREPNVIRIAPAPLYNTFEEVFLFVEILKEELLKLSSIKHG